MEQNTPWRVVEVIILTHYVFSRVMYHYLHNLLGNTYSKIIGPNSTLRGNKLMFHYSKQHIWWEYVVEDGKSGEVKGGKGIIPIVKSDWHFVKNKKFNIKSY